MGFRVYLGVVSKSVAESLRTLTVKEIQAKYESPSDIYKMVYELDTYTEIGRFNLFDDPDTHAYYNNDNFLQGLTKNGFKELILKVKSDIVDFYTRLNVKFINKNYNSIDYFLKSVIKEWQDPETLDFYEDSPELTPSYSRELAIFELLRIYKSFNWDENVLIINGY